jgi:hypothetical protein
MEGGGLRGRGIVDWHERRTATLTQPRFVLVQATRGHHGLENRSIMAWRTGLSWLGERGHHGLENGATTHPISTASLTTAGPRVKPQACLCRKFLRHSLLPYHTGSKEFATLAWRGGNRVSPLMSDDSPSMSNMCVEESHCRLRAVNGFMLLWLTQQLSITI